MAKIKTFFRKYKIYLFILVPVLLIVLYFVFANKAPNGQVYTVARADVEQSILLSGQVRTSDRADLGFAAGGRIAQILVKNNQKVKQGQILAQLEVGDLAADLKIKQANLRASNIDLEAAKQDLDKITIEEDTRVESAYRALLSGDLGFDPKDVDYDVDAPRVSGIYDGAEGTYEININKDEISFVDVVLKTFGLEKMTRVLNDEGSTMLGTRGLYISFPDDVSLYDDTSWVLDIPNKAGDSYVANYNTYNEAKKRRDVAIDQALFKYKKLLTQSKGDDTGVAQAEVDKIYAEIRKNTIYAPFEGIATNIEKQVGENASIGERIVSVLGEDKLEVVLQVSELDVSKLVPDFPVDLRLDALLGERFTGFLKTINSRDTQIDGVPVYEAFVEVAPDPRIKTGMSVTGSIIINSKNDVVVIPNYFITKNGDKNTVEIFSDNGSAIEKEVVLGVMGTDSMVEIVSGLNEGDKIISTLEK